MCSLIILFFDSMPQYIGESIVGLITVVIAGLIVGYFSSKYFARINEIARVEGLLFEKKIPVYKEIYALVELMNQLQSIRHNKMTHILEMIDLAGFSIQDKASYQVAGVFMDYKEMISKFLDIDKYIAENRLYYDEDVYLQLLLFQNYIIVFNRFHVVYREAVSDCTNDEELMDRVEQSMFIALGIILFDDFAEQTSNVLSCLRNSLNNVSLKRRNVPRFDYKFFNDHNEFMLSHMKKSMILNENDKIMKLITSFVSMTIEECVKD